MLWVRRWPANLDGCGNVGWWLSTVVKDARNRPEGAGFVSDKLEATTGFEPVIRVLKTPALPLGYVALLRRWCRGGDLNPYALSGTAPSRRRVYQFHHLGVHFMILIPRRARQQPSFRLGSGLVNIRLIPRAFEGLVEEVAELP